MTDTRTDPRFTLMTDRQSRRMLSIIRYTFLVLCLIGFVFYPLDLWILNHYTDVWESHIPFFVAAPSFLFTALMLISPRTKAIRYPFMVLMALNILMGLTGSILHFGFNLDWKFNWTLKDLQDGFEGGNPVLAALAFAHLGVTGLLCSLFPPEPRAGLATRVPTDLSS
ncbi:MAG TPA: hypothetical protein VHN99_06280 [Deinococcales bacterium]|nr:hypothetical protein [Deinococcales bacterium]